MWVHLMCVACKYEDDWNGLDWSNGGRVGVIDWKSEMQMTQFIIYTNR